MHKNSTEKVVSVHREMYAVASQMLIETFTNCKNEANLLVGLGPQKFLLRLSDLCLHALLGLQRHPGNHNDPSSFICANYYPDHLNFILSLSYHGKVALVWNF